MSGVCGCCSALKPRYKRLIDNIFPDDPQEGLVKNNMEKLTFYGITNTEKLDRIGQYLAQRLCRDVARLRHRKGYVFMSMEALDRLLVTCHAHSLNLFVESFLKMVQKLLETDDPDLKVLAVESFVKFANIEEITPNYHRRSMYDFFVSKFSSMCHSTDSNPDTRLRIRIAGLQGIQGVVRKTVSDDLQVNIWEHMNKIVPSLLYNMQQYSVEAEPETPKEEETNPAAAAENVLRDVTNKASFGNIQNILKPLLEHLDNHHLWVPNEFAVKSLRIIMFSVQAQYGHEVVKMLMTHLDVHNQSDPKVKAGIVDVVSNTVVIAAGGSIGPSVLDVFNSLLRHLRKSIEVQTTNSEDVDDEMKFQDTIINTIGEFANNLPDYQKIDIMMFIMSKVPTLNEVEIGVYTKHVQLQTNLLRTILKVATKYKTTYMNQAFQSPFLEPLLQMSLSDDQGTRLIVQHILHTLLDRHNNSQMFTFVRTVKDISELKLSIEKPSKQDTYFMRKTGNQFYSHICENIQMESNKVANFESLYCTMCLLCIELGEEDVQVELFRLVLTIQHSVNMGSLPMTHKCAIHAVIITFMDLVSQLIASPALGDYVQQIIEARQKDAPHFLPEFAFNRNNKTESYPETFVANDEWMFSSDTISDILSASGYNTLRLADDFHYNPTGRSLAAIIRSTDQMDASGRTIADSTSLTLSLESLDSSPGQKRKSLVEEITFESLKKVLADESEHKKAQEKKQKEILETFQTAPFEEIVAKSEAQANDLQERFNKILDGLAMDKVLTTGQGVTEGTEDQTIGGLDITYPDLFVY